MAKHFNFISETQLGDCMLHAHFMRKVCEANQDITFNFHLIDKHKEQVVEYISDIEQINVCSYESAPINALRGWVGQFGMPKLPCALDGLRLASYQALSEIKMGIECPFKSISDILYDHPKLMKYSKDLPSYDVLLVNSIGQSAQQTTYNELDFINFCNRLKDAGKTVITAKKIKDVECTLDKNLTVMGIGGQSINCKVIVGVVTGSLQCCFNIFNTKKKIFCIDVNHFFRAKNFNMINSVNDFLF